MKPDESVFPHLAQYINELPQGMGSYPEVLTKADFSLLLRGHLAPVFAEGKLPFKLRSLLEAPWKAGDWIPATSYVGLCALARDRLWTTEEAYHKGMLQVSMEMYKGPVYRALFVMFGPSLVAMSAAKRWYTLHQGTELVMKKQTKDSAHMVLTYPPKLFSKTGVQSLGAAFCGIAEGSRGKDATFELLSMTQTMAEVMIRWAY